VGIIGVTSSLNSLDAVVSHGSLDVMSPGGVDSAVFVATGLRSWFVAFGAVAFEVVVFLVGAGAMAAGAAGFEVVVLLLGAGAMAVDRGM
jgi:hypothetical protein